MRFRSWTGAAALVLCTQLVLAQESAWTLLEKGIQEYRKGHTARAEKFFDASIRMDARCQDSCYYLGLIAEKKRMPRKAVAYFQMIEKKHPSYSLAAERLGSIALANGQKEDALRFYKIHAKDRPSGRAHMVVAGVQLDLKKYKEAEESLQGAEKFWRGNLDLIEMRGRLYMETERYPEALDAYTAILKKVPIDNTARVMRAICLQRLERMDDAVGEYQKVLQRDPYHRMALKALIGHFQSDPSKKGVVAEYRKRLKAVIKKAPRVRRVSGKK